MGLDMTQPSESQRPQLEEELGKLFLQEQHLTTPTIEETTQISIKDHIEDNLAVDKNQVN